MAAAGTYRLQSLIQTTSSNAPTPGISQWDVISQDVGHAFADGRPEEELRPKIRLWCDEARRRQLAPEQFLVVIKSQLIRVPGLRRMARDASARDKTLTRVVTMCIEEYFRERG